jgi:glycosyltransferase involved in cell wall biosynthesis
MLLKNKFSQIHLLGLKSKWAIGSEFNFLKKNFLNFGFNISESSLALNQCVYLPTKYSLKKSIYHFFNNKVFFDYFHGNPGLSNEFKELFYYILNNQNKYFKIRVTNSRMLNIFLNNNLKNVEKIPLGVDTNVFKNNIINKNLIRSILGIPKDAILVGSFQKDGVGWSEGNIMKSIKGPDIFLNTLEIIKKKFKEIYVLLLGPSRGYVIKGLEKLNIPFKNFYEDKIEDVVKYYCALDLYLITSREEGGPKSLLEAMACNIPVITTPVGQAIDLIEDNVNGIKVKDFEAEEIASRIINLLNDSKKIYSIITNGRNTSKSNDYSNQKQLWKNFFNI